MSRSNSCRLYIGKLSDAAQSRDIDHMFRSFGKITEIDMKNGYAFIEFDQSEDARCAMLEMNGASLLGRRILVQPAHPDPRNSTTNKNTDYQKSRPERLQVVRAVVRNLSTKVDWQELKHTLTKFVPVKFVEAHFYRPREGAVEFYTREDLKTAIDHFDGTDYFGRKIEMFEDLPEPNSSPCSSSESSVSPERLPRSRSRRSRSRSSDSRSRSRSCSRDRKCEKENGERKRSRKVSEKENGKHKSRRSHSENDKTSDYAHEKGTSSSSRNDKY